MKYKFRSRIAALTLLAAVSLLPSCRSAVEKTAAKIRIEAVEQIDRHALSGVDLTLRVNNGSGYKLVLRDASLTLWFAGACVGDVTLREGVEVPRRTTQSVMTRWRLRINDPIALFALSSRLGAGDLSQVCVSYEVHGRGGPAKVNISQEMIPLSDFLRIFGLTIEEVKTYFSE